MPLEVRFDLLPKQAQYVNSKAKTAMYCGGVGAGKTIADVCLGIKYGLEYPGIEIMYVLPTYAMLRDVVIREFRQHCPPALIAKQVWGVYPEVEFFTGTEKKSKIRFRAFQDAGRPKGLTIGLLIEDENVEIPEKVDTELDNRLRQEGMPCHKRLSTNPDSKDHYVHKRYIQPYLDGKLSPDLFEYIHTTTFDNYLLPETFLADRRRLEFTRPMYYRRSVLGEWGELNEDAIGAFAFTPNFTTPYKVAWIDTSFSDKTVSDRTSVSIVGFVPDANPQNFWKIQFTGMSWEKSISNPEVINGILQFLDRYHPIETCLESQMAESTQVFIDRFKQGEKDLGLKIKNHWTYAHQTRNKHERIMLYVAGNKDRLYVLDDVNREYLNGITSYTKDSKHDDNPDSLAGAINLWQTSPILRNYIVNMERLKRVAR